MTTTQELFVGFGPKSEEVVKTAKFSPCGRYRYELTRQWGAKHPMTWVMLNPSTADAEVDDPTIRRCMGFARREGCGGIVVVNLFGLRATDPKELATAADPNGPDNLWYVCVELSHAYHDNAPIVLAWGAYPRPWHSEAWRWIVDHNPEIRFSSYDFRCLGHTKDGSPRHPLYVRADQPLEPMWR